MRNAVTLSKKIMASIKVKFRSSRVKGDEGVIYYQVIHERRVRQLHTDYHIRQEEWDEEKSRVITRVADSRRSHILSIRERIRWDMERLSKIIRRFDTDGISYTADDLIEEFRRYTDEYSLFNYMENCIIRLKQCGRVRTAETYAATLNSFRKFREDKDIMLDSLTSETMELYETWHNSRGNSLNTISFYLRVLRAVYNRAVDEGITENRRPFRHVYTGVEKTVKRAISLQHMKRIKKLDLTLNPTLDYARDMFMMSFYLRGMSFIDMAYLRKSDLRDGCVIYRRRKTGQQLIIAWTEEMEAILRKYPENPTQYLLPVIRKENINDRYAYRNVGYNINHNLKRVGELAGLPIPLTMYVARHSWASAAKAKGIPLSVISEGMGHDSEMTTRIYLASLDTSVVNKANAMILKSL